MPSRALARRLLLAAALAAISASASPARAGSGSSPDTCQVRDGQHDFDFLFGKWKVARRRLKAPLTGSTEWTETSISTSTVRPIWGGKGHIDEAEGTGSTDKLEAITIRLYNPTSRQWSLNWVNHKSPELGVPTIGQFKDGRGEFYDHEIWKGRAILVRYVWSNITHTSAHFEQSFSVDGGKTWEVNWIADSTRIE